MVNAQAWKRITLSLFFSGCCFLLLVCGHTQQQQDQPKKPDTTSLNPVFRYSAEEVQQAVKAGQDAAKHGRKPAVFTDKFKQNPVWTRGKKGKAHESYVWAIGINAESLSLLAYQRAAQYENDPALEKYKATGTYAHELQFDVVVASYPRVARRIWEHNRDADVGDVRVIKFVLSDDQGHNYTAETTSGQDQSGTMTFSGNSAVPTFGQSRTSFGANDNAGYSMTGYASSSFIQTQFIPWTAQRPYYQARYFARFPLFDADGHARIGPDVKEITLHIINENGEMSTVYKLEQKKEGKR